MKNLKLIHVLFGIVALMCALPCAGLVCSPSGGGGITHDQANCYRAVELVGEQEGWNDSTLYHAIEETCK